MMKYPLTILLAFAATPGLTQEKNFYRLRPEVLECIVEHIGLYRAMGDLVYVDAAECPPEGAVNILDNLINEIPNPEFAEEYDSFLVLTALNLDCLDGVAVSSEARAYRFYPEQCRVEAE
ncbi:hypothetical protein [Roseovarius aestuarii]|uniref:Uncharacterized protein n=1 Tax=Roseovarius aestuarii TaxID=475083 RepID=A0A1X7BYP0_9RHOB|nr:hypothetical protein [Roseovarius aestuarii]SMC14767.1 hypothetical protein ROA7745_04637 [Roseovarius aestuarii]